MKLYMWRDEEANKRGVELWRILPNRSLDEIAEREPKTLQEFVTVSGVGPTKLSLYGQVLIDLVSGGEVAKPPVLGEFERARRAEIAKAESAKLSVEAHTSASLLPESKKKNETPDALPVGQYLELANRALRQIPARVRGEVTAINFRAHAYFTIKDAEDKASMDVLMWATDYRMCGTELLPGMEVVVTGFMEIYKPSGKLTFHAKTVELIGEGVLKKQYELLKKKLGDEGLFREERKRKLPALPEKVGVITSRNGAVIHDFMNNLGLHGFQIKFVDSRVEGVLAVADILGAMSALAKEDLDVLVLIRGGGSLESLQCFNNEHVVRTIAEFPVPVICAIGHDQDVPLAQMVADYAPSTPTACTALLNESWKAARHELVLAERVIVGGFEIAIARDRTRLLQAERFFKGRFDALYAVVETTSQSVRDCIPRIELQLVRYRNDISQVRSQVMRVLDFAFERVRVALDRASSSLDAHDPMRQLRLGYSVARINEKVVRRTREVSVGEAIELQVSDGVIDARVERIYDRKENS